jgi:hypothetical protein
MIMWQQLRFTKVDYMTFKMTHTHALFQMPSRISRICWIANMVAL